MQKEQLKIILENQIIINEKFAGKDWKNQIDKNNIEIALLTEMAEYFESCPENWKWWRQNLKNDIQNLYVEAIDVIHFAVSLLLSEKDIDEILADFDELKDVEIQSIHPMDAYFLFHAGRKVYNFLVLIKSLFDYVGLDEEKLFDVYIQKAKINLERANSGYKDGKYEKIDENGNEDNRKIKV